MSTAAQPPSQTSLWRWSVPITSDSSMRGQVRQRDLPPGCRNQTVRQRGRMSVTRLPWDGGSRRKIRDVLELLEFL